MRQVVITDHAYSRMKERLGLNKKAATRIAELALNKGIKYADTRGQLNKYMTSQTLLYREKGQSVMIYGENVYCYVKAHDSKIGDEKVLLVTVWPISNRLKKKAIGRQRKMVNS